MTSSRAVLVALFLVPAVLKIIVSAGATSFGTDGSYYAEIASHVQNGEGLTTRLSLFHHGYETFPHPTPVYPLWPLMLGMTARVVGLDVAAIWLPTALYFCAVLFAWLWARGLPRVPLFERYPDGPDTAHAAALLVACNVAVFDKTSIPYTEGLALTLLFACLWRCQSLWRTRGWVAGVEMGVWVGVVFLARSQLVLVAMAAACAFTVGLAAVPGRRRTIAMGLACAAVAFAIVLPHYLNLTGITVRPGTGLLRFELAQANSLLTPVDVLTDQVGLIAVAVDRLGGVPVAFSQDGGVELPLRGRVPPSLPQDRRDRDVRRVRAASRVVWEPLTACVRTVATEQDSADRVSRYGRSPRPKRSLIHASCGSHFQEVSTFPGRSFRQATKGARSSASSLQPKPP